MKTNLQPPQIADAHKKVAKVVAAVQALCTVEKADRCVQKQQL